MKKLIVLLLVLCSYSGFSQKTEKHGHFKDYYKNGKLKKEGYYRHNNKVGAWKEYYDTGELSSVYTYDTKGEKTGLRESYFKNGNTKSKITQLKDGSFFSQGYYEDSGDLFYEMTLTKEPKSSYIKKDGFYREYYKNKVLKIEATYANGSLNGFWKRFYKSGEKEWEVGYYEDYKQGVYKQFYENGNVKLEGYHLLNLKTGVEKRYYENGNLEWEGTYLKNEFDNTWVQYDSVKSVINTLKYKKGKLKNFTNKIVLKSTVVPKGAFEQVPIYPGCENLIGNPAHKKCMSKKIAEHVSRNFNSSLANNLGLEGKQRINVIFKIDKTGRVIDARARAPHQILEKEAIKVIKKLPRMKPGIQRGKPVNVPYSLPIIFVVQGKRKVDNFDDSFKKN